MEKLELQKIANEVRKDIVTAVHAAKPAIRAVPCQQQIYLHTCILKK